MVGEGGGLDDDVDGPRAADALVLFGITGDLARTLVLPATAAPPHRPAGPDEAAELPGPLGWVELPAPPTPPP